MTNELLTVRFNSVNEILTLQEEEIVKKVSVSFCLNSVMRYMSVVPERRQLRKYYGVVFTVIVSYLYVCSRNMENKMFLVEKEVHVLIRNLVQMEKIAMCVLLDPN